MFIPNRANVARLLEDDDTFAFTLMAILLSSYGDATFTEEPEVLFKNLEEDFHCKLSTETETRINAALVAMTTDLAYTNINVFKATVLAFTEGDVGELAIEHDEDIDASAALWTITELGLLEGDDTEDETFERFSPKIHEYVKELISEVAIDREEVPDDVDTIDEAMDEPHFVTRVVEDLKELAIQLKDIGADPAVVNELIASKGISAEE